MEAHSRTSAEEMNEKITSISNKLFSLLRYKIEKPSSRLPAIPPAIGTLKKNSNTNPCITVNICGNSESNLLPSLWPLNASSQVVTPNTQQFPGCSRGAEEVFVFLQGERHLPCGENPSLHLLQQLEEQPTAALR